MASTAETAETYFKALTEDDTVVDVLRILAQGWEHEVAKPVIIGPAELELQKKVEESLGAELWAGLTHVSHRRSIGSGLDR